LKALRGSANFDIAGQGVRPVRARPPFPLCQDPVCAIRQRPTDIPTEGKFSVNSDATERLDEIRKKVQELRGYL